MRTVSFCVRVYLLYSTKQVTTAHATHKSHSLYDECLSFEVQSECKHNLSICKMYISFTLFIFVYIKNICFFVYIFEMFFLYILSKQTLFFYSVFAVFCICVNKSICQHFLCFGGVMCGVIN